MPGHRKVKEEKHLCLLRHVRGQRLFLQAVRVRIDELRDIETRTRNMVQLKFFLVLNVLDAKKGEPNTVVKHQKDDQQASSS